MVSNQIYKSKINIEKIKIAELRSIVYKYFNTLSKEQIIKFFDNQNEERNLYMDYFLSLFSKFNYQNKISGVDFKYIIENFDLSLSIFLRYSFFSKNYPKETEELLLCKSESFEFLFNNFTKADYTNYFPEGISKTTWTRILENYVDSPNAHLNKLEIVLRGFKEKGSRYYNLDLGLIQKIQKKIDVLTANMKDNYSEFTFMITTDLEFYKEYEKEFIEFNSNEKVVNLKDWNKPFYIYIDENLLRNKKRIYEQIEYLTSIEYIFSKKKMLQITEKKESNRNSLSELLRIKTKNQFSSGLELDLKMQLTLINLDLIQRILLKHNSSIEEVIEYFFQEYCKQKYNIEFLSIKFAPQNADYVTKISTIFRLEEKIRKQYFLLCEYQEVNKDFYNYLDTTPSIEDLSSLLPMKNVWVKDGSILSKTINLLFSHTSSLNKNEWGYEQENFFQFQKNYQIPLKFFQDMDSKEDIEFLIRKGVLKNEGVIEFSEPNLKQILEEINKYGEYNYNQANDIEKKFLNLWIENGFLDYNNKFFTTKEADFLNYLLNNKKFDDNLGLRNKYQHGGPILSSEEYSAHYFIGLLIIIIYMAKINEELKTFKKDSSDDS